MATVVWEWKYESDSWLEAAVTTSDGYVIVAGSISGSSDDVDFLAMKLDPMDGEVLWTYQNGTSRPDRFNGAAAGYDGSVILCGFTHGNWSAANQGPSDYVVVKLDSDGEEIWRLQAGSNDSDYLSDAAVAEDDSAYLAGTYSADFFLLKVDNGGNMLWNWTGDTGSLDSVRSIAISGEDESVVLAGYTLGNWSGTGMGASDFAAIKFDSDGNELWRWQDGTNSSDYIFSVILEGSSIIMAGYSYGSYTAPNAGSSDAVAIKMDADGNELWRWQDGTTEFDRIADLVMENDSLVLAGFTAGNWSNINEGSYDYLAVKLNASDGSTQAWTWQSGTNESDVIHAITSVSDELIFAAGESSGSAPVMLLRTGSSTTAPTTSPTPSLTLSPSPAPVIPPSSPPPTIPVTASPVIAPASPSPSTAFSGGTLHVLTPNPTTLTSSGTSPTLVIAGAVTAVVVVALLALVFCRRRIRASLETCYQADVSSSAVGPASGNISEDGSSVNKGPSKDHDARDDSTSGSGGGVGVSLTRAILETAEELAQSSTVPGICEAATLVSVLMRLVVDHKESGSAAGSRLRWCRSIIVLLGRAAELLSKGGHSSDEAEGVLLEDVRESIDDLIQLIQVYKSKNRMVRVMASSLFKRRQEELEATINMAVNRLQMGLQLHGGHKLNAVGQEVTDIKDVLQLQQRTSQSSPSMIAEQALAESRRKRRQRRLEQLEIPEDDLTLTNELLGKGGFGSVYMADYNGRNAAAKVVEIEHNFGGADGLDGQGDAPHENDQRLERQKMQRRAFTRELEAMTRLRSPHTVDVYGAVTSRSDRLILVMELLSGGSLRTFLKDSSDPIEEDKARRIVGEVCAGMVFLHGKQTVHGDLKSANVLFDGHFRAKIGDFGTSRWTQHTASTGLATYTAKNGENTQMSLPWAAPEVLDKGERSFKSDVYSFGMVIWEVLTREIPWADEPGPLDVYRRVVFKRERPDIPEEAPADLADIVRSCWTANPSSRPSFKSILEMRCKGWKEA